MLRSFRFQLAAAYALGMVVLVGALSLGLGAAATDAALRDQSDTLQTLARSTGAMLAEGLAERQREVELLARFGISPDRAHWRATLEQVQRSRSKYSWIGVADRDGQVLAATHDLLRGQSVAQRPWFIAGLRGPHVGDVHAAKLLASLLPQVPGEGPPRFLDFAAPLQGADGRVTAVLAVHADWTWVRDVIASLRSPLARENGVRVFILDRRGDVIHRPDGPPGSDRPVALADLRGPPGERVWDDGQRYLTAAAPLPVRNAAADLGWTIVTRQPVDAALAGARQARLTVLWAGAAAALLASALAWWMAGRMSKPLQRVASAARRLRAGQLDAPLPLLSGSSEVRDLTEALREMTAARAAHERALEQANHQLERRVAERTEALRIANEQLHRLASRDALTGLPNRRSLDDALRAEVQRHRRSGQALAIALADVDHFKRVNDTHGHAAGDLVLRAVADALAGACRTTDLVGRYGGEEFMLLMPETTLEGAQVACEKLRQRIADLGGAVPVTMSFGLVAPAQYFALPQDAVDAADQALYLAKDRGRNRVCVFDGATPEAARASGFAPLDEGVEMLPG